ncbi:hypothetical protein ILYODFUR_026882 [Ilyodon furcidens]|uniref:Uncharacterized protein n=1 Tax=Ilyodon furcidens TaxID=33524 RepID=A0ABV0TLZ5_9TELE
MSAGSVRQQSSRCAAGPTGGYTPTLIRRVQYERLLVRSEMPSSSSRYPRSPHIWLVLNLYMKSLTLTGTRCVQVALNVTVMSLRQQSSRRNKLTVLVLATPSSLPPLSLSLTLLHPLLPSTSSPMLHSGAVGKISRSNNLYVNIYFPV